jgi:predicted membrane-bound spermidine synthase
MINQHSLSLAIVGLSAACGLIVEIVAGRMVAPYMGMSLYTWTAIIAVVLAGFSLGHWVGGLLAERPEREALRGVAWSLLFAAISTAATLITIRIIAPAVISAELAAMPTVLAVTMPLFFLPSMFVGIPSPVLTKVALDKGDLQQSGRIIGAFYAIGAIGSIAGTLAAGFLFISWLGTTLTLLIVALLYLLMAFAMFAGKSAGGISAMRNPAIVTLVAIATIAIAGHSARAFTDPCQIASSYYCIRVVDVSSEHGEPARVMVLDHLGHGVNVRNSAQKLVSPYVELQDSLARIHSGRHTPFRVFFVGGGAYTLPRAWAAARPDSEITVAEIDPMVTATAVNDLWLKLSDRIRPVHKDARIALNQSGKGYFDIIVGDAFHDIVIPQHLVTREFFKTVATRLKTDGIYLMNVVDHRQMPRLLLSIRDTIATSFANVEIWASNDNGLRATFVIAATPTPTPYEALRSKVSAGVIFKRIRDDRLAELRKQLKPLMLTDDFAPVDRLIGVE